MNMIQYIAVAAIPILFAITVHEVAHGYVASKFGDNTAKMLGRLTLNPLKHIDLVGTVIVPLLLLFLGGFIFGWAKPVPVDPRNMTNPKKNMILVAAAGPLANLLMALIWAAILKIALLLSGIDHWLAVPLEYMGKIGIQINIILMVLNLFPIPPLDGGRVLMGFLSPKAAHKLGKIEPYGIFIVLFLIVFGVFHAVLMPILNAFISLMSLIFSY
ncbi:MAG: site-2 protease family protein [Gammaproteobacteria bacterium]